MKYIVYTSDIYIPLLIVMARTREEVSDIVLAKFPEVIIRKIEEEGELWDH